MITIHKFELAIIDTQEIVMQLVRVLTAQEQNGKLILWAIVDTETAPRKIKFRIAGTGNPLYNHYRSDYIATVQMSPFVWHVFIENKN